MEWLEEVTSMRFLVCLVVPVTLLLAASTRWRRKLPFPPGPTPLPIVGNMLLMGQLTHRGLAKLAERYGGLCHLSLGFVHVFAVSTPEIARQVLQVQDAVFSNRSATIAITYLTYDRADMAFAHYGPFWRQIRKLCVMKLFSRKRAESWASVREEVDAAVRAVADGAGAAVNLGELMFNLTKNITFRAAFGTQNHENQEEFIAILQEFSVLFGAFNIGDFIPWVSWMDLQGINKRFKVAREALDGFIDKIIEEHMANPKELDAADADMVDEMLAFFEESRDRTKEKEADELQGTLRLTRNNIKAIIMDVMFGGTETVASGIEWAIAELMKNPEDMRRVQEEQASIVGLHRKVCESDLDKLPYLKCVVKETLRLHPPIPILLHETAEDCQLTGYAVPARSRVMINVWAIGRDKSAWADADVFRPSRFAPGGEAAALDFRGGCFEFLPFGSGRRSCPGMQLGLHALELAVAQLTHCFSWELPNGMKRGELDMGDVFGLTAPRAVRLVAVPTPRLTCSPY
ncbi:hypothetical protein OPV22_001220 [Ensete ventricosum]|uniref:Cytochrome P450 84A1 n=1 Tax=Ensete ventricosum TaxID=4639 RepID=A0AAV8QBP5_ENSVE|nr:hypothetical protein OPV22_001220 [Ensete ventricosum]